MYWWILAVLMIYAFALGSCFFLKYVGIVISGLLDDAVRPSEVAKAFLVDLPIAIMALAIVAWAFSLLSK